MFRVAEPTVKDGGVNKKNSVKNKGSFKRYVTLFLAKICPSLPLPLPIVTVRNVSNMSHPSVTQRSL